MRFDHAVIPLAPRSTANCLDLGLVLLRAHLGKVLTLWAAVAVPASAGAYFLVERLAGGLWEWLLVLSLMLYLATAVLGAVLAVCIAPTAFGEPFSFRDAVRRLGVSELVRLLVSVLILRCAGLLLGTLGLVPGWYLLVRTGFRAENLALSNLSRHLHDRKTDELLKGEVGELCVRALLIGSFCGLLWISLSATADFISTHLLGFSLLAGGGNIDADYLEQGESWLESVASHVWTDPVIAATLIAVGLFAYVPGRLAWFFCYVDVRVRRDCWDMELQILREAARLEEAT